MHSTSSVLRGNQQNRATGILVRGNKQGEIRRFILIATHLATHRFGRRCAIPDAAQSWVADDADMCS